MEKADRIFSPANFGHPPPCSNVVAHGGLNRWKNSIEWRRTKLIVDITQMPPLSKKAKFKQRKRAKARVQVQKKDPLMVGGQRPRPMFVDYKDVELLKKLTSRQGKILNRRKSGCSAISQHAVAIAIKRARFMALLPYVTD